MTYPLTSEDAGGWVGQEGWRVQCPPGRDDLAVYPSTPTRPTVPPYSGSSGYTLAALEGSPVVVNFEIEA